MGFHKFLIHIYLSSEFCNTWLYWSAMKRTSCSFGQRLMVQQKLGLLFEKMKPWSTNSSSVYYHSHKFCELVFLNSANKSVSGNFFSLFSSVNINKIQKNNKKICTHFFRHIVQEEISACAAFHMRYVMDACDRMQPIILLPPVMGMSFVLVALTRLIVSKPKHQVTWSHRTCVNFPFLRGERIQ